LIGPVGGGRAVLELALINESRPLGEKIDGRKQANECKRKYESFDIKHFYSPNINLVERHRQNKNFGGACHRVFAQGFRFGIWDLGFADASMRVNPL
jgi:hypothetical protein